MLTRRNIIVVVGLLALLAGVVTALGLGAMKARRLTSGQRGPLPWSCRSLPAVRPM